jgi:transcriptional regulator with XRE-family HTH domain
MPTRSPDAGGAPPRPVYWRRVVLDPVALSAIRERRGLTKSGLAREAGISGGSLRDLESGRRNASPTMLIRLAQALAVPIPALLHPTDPPHHGTAESQESATQVRDPEPIVTARPPVTRTPDTDQYNPGRAFGQRIRAARKRLGLSQERLAFVCGFHRTYTANLERGAVNPSLYNILRLATGLGVDPGELVEGLGPVELPPSPLLL